MGSTFVVANQIVSFLSQYGRVSWEHEVLGLFLNLVKTLTGVQQQEFLSEMLRRHHMMTPVSPGLPVTRRADDAPPSGIAEKIITSNTLRPIAFLDHALSASRPVAFIQVRDGIHGWSGTGFLITDDLLITNHHVLPEADLAATATFRFNYEDGTDGQARQPQDYRAATLGVFHANAALDYAVVEVAEQPGRAWGSLRIAAHSPRVGHRVNIIQHPGGQPKQIAMHSNFVEYGDRDVLQYLTTTLPGSSGSPVLTDDWLVCALHHAGGRILEPASGRYFSATREFCSAASSMIFPERRASGSPAGAMTAEDLRARVVQSLSALPNITEPGQRRFLLDNAGFGHLTAEVDWSGSAVSFVTNLLEVLVARNGGTELARFLDKVAATAPLGEDRRRHLRELGAELGSLAPAAVAAVFSPTTGPAQVSITCRRVTEREISELGSKYMRNLYFERGIVAARFAEFLNSDATCFLVVSKPGRGKTSMLCRIAEELRDEQDVLLLSGRTFITDSSGLLSLIASRLGYGGGWRTCLTDLAQHTDPARRDQRGPGPAGSHA